ncbi:MAG TPA: FAD-dependent oxidoreductase, partial [Anaerolineales bacterium]
AGIRRELLTFIVGGGGFSGVESMAALNDLVRELSSHFPHVARDDIRTIIVQPGDRVLPELSPGLAHYAQSELEQRGVEVMLKTKLSAAGEGYVDVQPEHGGPVQRIPTHMLIWTGGVTPSPVIESAGLPLGRHHGIVVDACCRVQDHPGFWALGDCAEIPKPGGHGSYASTAQNATREGPLVARNIASVARGEAPHPFVYQPVGELAIVGRRAGVASVYGVHLRGGVAWIAWRFIYLAKMPRMMQRAHVALNWLLDLAFGRDLVALPGVQAEAVSGRIADQREIVASR